MGLKLNSTAGGSVELNVDQNVTGNYKMTLPANGSGVILTTNATYGSMKNRIINGDFRIDQRFAGAANNNIAATGQYVVDRWYHTTSSGSTAAKLRFQQNNTNGPGSSATLLATGFPNYFGANVVSSNTVNSTDYWYLSQPIEGFNTFDLNWGTSGASSVTLSFWVYSSIAGTHGGNIFNSAGDRTYPFTYTISSANNWQYQTVTIPGDTTGTWFTNNSIGVQVAFTFGVGSSYNGTNNSWNAGSKWPTGVVQPVSSSNGSFYLTGVQLEKGTANTSWDWRHYTTELQLCQRYYELAAYNFYGYQSTTGEYIGGAINWSVTKRTTPTLGSIVADPSVASPTSTNVNTASVAQPGIYGCAGLVLGSSSAPAQVGIRGYMFSVSAELGVQN